MRFLKALTIVALITALGCSSSSSPAPKNPDKLEGVKNVDGPKGENKAVAPPK